MAETKTQKKYYEAVGRRKAAIARVRIMPGKKEFVVNDKPLDEYFSVERRAAVCRDPFETVDKLGDFGVSVHVSGGGVSSQADAIRLGVARALVEYDADLRPPLKKEGYLTRDARVKERKKFGLKKARKAPQWSKR